MFYVLHPPYSDELSIPASGYCSYCYRPFLGDEPTLEIAGEHFHARCFEQKLARIGENL